MRIKLVAALSILPFCLLSFQANANQVSVPLNSTQTGIKIKSISPQEIVMDLSLDSINLKDVKMGGRNFVQIESNVLMKRFGRGTPNLPVFTKLIQVPAGMTAKIEVSDFDTQEVNLADLGVSNQIAPTQQTVSKSAKTVKFYFNSAAYAANSFNTEAMATIEDLGLLRNVRLARIQVAPFEFNPAQGVLRIHNNIHATIKFEASQFVAALNHRYDSNDYNQMLGGVIGAAKPLFVRAETPTYVIVSPRKFEKDLQRFIAWKEKSGYKVVQAYTDMREVGTTSDTIKAYLKDFFVNPPTGFGPQQFILLVGDVEDIPTFAGATEYHSTDLQYGEYTGDFLPDAFYGRFSATNSSELNAIIDKTLAYEMRTLPDLRYLTRATMVAGNDSSHENWSNGQINYGVKNYFNSANGITSKTYLQPEPANSPYSAKIKADINEGSGFVNYTAHCSSDGWAGPSFSIADLSRLTNTDKYGIWIGNCCQSASFNTDSFAEAALRLPKKGAVGYIGASDYSYWDEDYWWAVGFKDIVSQPVYNPASTGVYDQLFTKANPVSKLGQMIYVGNLAVEASTSASKGYYWEIYNVSGDPSLQVQFQ